MYSSLTKLTKGSHFQLKDEDLTYGMGILVAERVDLNCSSHKKAMAMMCCDGGVSTTVVIIFTLHKGIKSTHCTT